MPLLNRCDGGRYSTSSRPAVGAAFIASAHPPESDSVGNRARRRQWKVSRPSKVHFSRHEVVLERVHLHTIWSDRPGPYMGKMSESRWVTVPRPRGPLTRFRPYRFHSGPTVSMSDRYASCVSIVAATRHHAPDRLPIVAIETECYVDKTTFTSFNRCNDISNCKANFSHTNIVKDETLFVFTVKRCIYYTINMQ